MNNHSDKLLYNILVDDDFINYALSDSVPLAEKWKKYFENHPEHIAVAKTAIRIINGEDMTHRLSGVEAEKMKLEIIQKSGTLNYN